MFEYIHLATVFKFFVKTCFFSAVVLNFSNILFRTFEFFNFVMEKHHSEDTVYFEHH